MFKYLLALPAAALLVASVPAATLTVPGDHATIGAAIAAAASSDTIVLATTATYPESITIDKPLTIKAAPDTNPVIAGTGVDTFVVKFVAGSEGTQFGDYTGGTIHINADTYTNTTTAIQYVQFQHTTGLVTLQRVKISASYNYHNNTTPIPTGFRQRDTNEMIRVGTGAAAAVGDVNLRLVEIEGGSHGIRLLSPNNSNTLNIDNCLISTAQFGIRFAGSTNVNIRNSFVRTENYLTWPALYYDSGFNRPVTIENSWIHCNGRNNAVGVAARRTHSTTVTNSVISISDQKSTLTSLLNFGANAYGEQWYIDHSDLMSSSTAHLIGLGQRAAAGARDLVITNSNIINKGVGALVSLPNPASTYTFGYDGAMIMRNNNHYNPNTTATASIFPNPEFFGFTTYTVQLPVAQLLPNYADPSVGNFTYTTPGLLTAGVDGTPMGSRRDFSAIELGAVPVELSSFGLN